MSNYLAASLAVGANMLAILFLDGGLINWFAAGFIAGMAFAEHLYIGNDYD